MRRKLFPLPGFNDELTSLIKKKKILQDDYEDFKRFLVENPESGRLISGTGGVRKARLKSTSKGKSGGFRVCYFDDPDREELFLMWIYAKNEKENLSSDEKKALKEMVKYLKMGKKK